MTTKRRRGVPPGSDSARTQGVELNPRECSTTDIAKAALRRWVAFIPFDDPTRHVMVDTTLLRAVGCRSASMILHQPPDTLIGDVAAWNVNIERAILCTFLKSLNCGELLFPEDMCIYDALKMFEMECVSVPSGVVGRAKDTPQLTFPMPCLATRAYSRSNAPTIKEISCAVVNALLEWPRLYVGLQQSLQNQQATFACTSTRVWIRFAATPSIIALDSDEAYAIAKRRPDWLGQTLAGIGLIHSKLCRTGKVTTQRDVESFDSLLKYGIESDPTRWFLSTQRDMPRCEASRKFSRAGISRGNNFARSILTSVLECGSQDGDLSKVNNTAPQEYARSCVSLALRLVRETPNCSHLYGMECSDDKGSTPERKAFEAALKNGGGKSIRWADGDGAAAPSNPLVFPPSFFPKEDHKKGPCVLVEFQ